MTGLTCHSVKNNQDICVWPKNYL